MAKREKQKIVTKKHMARQEREELLALLQRPAVAHGAQRVGDREGVTQVTRLGERLDFLLHRSPVIRVDRRSGELLLHLGHHRVRIGELVGIQSVRVRVPRS